MFVQHQSRGADDVSSINITQTLTKLSKTGGGRPLSDQDILKWANSTVQRAKPSSRPIRSFKDPSITTGLYFLDLLDAIRPGIVDPTMVIPVSETGDYEDRRQNGECACVVCVVPWLTMCAIAQQNSPFRSRVR